MATSALRAPLCLSIAGPHGDITVRYAFDLESDVQRTMHDALDAGGFYEPATSKLFLSILKPGDTFIDVGAHVGYFAMLAAAVVGNTGEVVAFEPSPGNYRHLVEHIALNGFTNVLPLHLAAGDREHVASLHLNSDNDGGHALWNVGRHEANTKSREHPAIYPAFVTRIDRVLRNRLMRSVRAIKLDVEGSEVLALRGALDLLAVHQVPFVVAEVNRSGLEHLGTSEQDLRGLMKSLGYETWVISDVEPELTRLSDDATIAGNYVFNLLFRLPGTVIT